jgi:two-component system phosphate regulon sensor histidine kinase PhoR
MMNLLINAVIYNKRGGSVDVSISEEDGFVEIAVKDTGIGISKADQGKIFTKFFRSKTAKELNAEGTGLGLYLVKSYVDKWGGKVSFESNDKTTFKIYLPKKTKPIN